MVNQIEIRMEIVRLMRPWQWVKNLFIFLPMFFAGQMGAGAYWVSLAWAFLAMSFVASSIYCINDIVDVEENRRHPHKCCRPVAKGSVSKGRAALVAAGLIVAGIGLPFIALPSAIAESVAVLMMGYWLMNIVYCLWLKRIAIVDVFCISIGFVLRVFIGGYACSIWVSPWLICLTFLLTLFLAFAKRRDDLIVGEREGIAVRKSSASYNMPFMNMTLGLLGAITMVCYILYTVQPDVEERLGTSWVYITSIFVLAGILRYLQIAIVDEKAGDPTLIMLKDRFIQGCLLAWALSYLFMIYV